MIINRVRTAIAAATVSLTVTAAWAQQPGQMAGMAPGSGGGAAMCAQNSEGVTRTIDVINARIEDARQTNDASKLRATIGDLQSVFAQIKRQLADCVALSGEAGGATGNMPGMDHSKVQAPGTQGKRPDSPSPAPGVAGGTAMAGMDHSKMASAPKPPQAGKAAGAAKVTKPAPMAGMDHSKMAAAPQKATGEEPAKMAGMDHSKMPGDKGAGTEAVVFTVRTDPAPPRSGKNDFEVTLKDAAGKPITDAVVSLAFSMPAMPSMTTDAVQLTSAGGGVYKGSGTIGMAGDWDVTITAGRKGQTLGTKKIKLTAK